MWAIMVLVSMISVTGFVSMANQIRTPISEVADSGDLAVNMREYRLAVVNYVRSNPTASGTIADEQLVFAPWYKRDPLWSNTVSGRVVTVYAKSRPRETITMAIVKMSGNSIYAGERDAATNTLYSPAFGPTTIALPPVIPAGAPVWIANLN